MGKVLSDIRSLSNLKYFKIISFHWNIKANFETKTLQCTTMQKYECLSNVDTHIIILDTKDLRIDNVKVNNENTAFRLNPYVESLGQGLEISLPSHLCTSGCSFDVEIDYETSPCASATQWLPPGQTLGKEKPYMYTQCQRLHARSILPCQDSPSCKFTFSAELTIPEDMVALMSAIKGEENILGNGQKSCSFKQDVLMSSYLLAIAIGPLVSRKVGPRSRVWCESQLIDACSYEFAQVEETLKIAESLLGPYVWGVYDMLILPPSFPPAGMENACLTFLTPTIITGDRSLTNVMVHEIIHGWTGNLVTNEKWEDFWLNEGFTRFIEAKIEGMRDGDEVRQFKMVNGWNRLIDTIKDRGATHKATALVPDLSCIKPGDASSPVPYEKGAAFLYYIESLVGGPRLFDPFLRSYIEHFKWKSIGTDDFKTYLLDYFQNKTQCLCEIDWNSWLYAPGMPPVDAIELYDTNVLEDCHQLCDKWKHASVEEIDSFPETDFSSLPTRKKIYFLSKLYLETHLSADHLRKMSDLYHILSSDVCSVKFPYFRMCIRAEWEESYKHVVQFLQEQGRTRFIRKLYKDLFEREDTKELALKTFQENKHLYHPIPARKIKQDMQLDEV